MLPHERLGNDDSEPAAHFGRPVSHDVVIRSPEEHSAAAQREGIVGFEMERAGVWDSFTRAVIKGVCDRADSHKNRWW